MGTPFRAHVAEQLQRWKKTDSVAQQILEKPSAWPTEVAFS